MGKKNNLWNDHFGQWLNLIALIIIICSILFFWSNNSKTDLKINKNYPTTEIKITISEKNNSEISKLIKQLNSKNKEILNIKKEIELKEKKSSDELKYYSTLIGFVLSIVGFFGFKSIHDTRQAAIERAVSEARNEAIKEAREASKNEAKIASITEARNIAESTSKQVAENTAIETSKNETVKFLSDEFPKQFRIQEEKYTSSFTEDLDKVSKDVDRLKNPEAYGDRNKSEIKIQEDIDKLKNKYDEILEIIYKIKIKVLEDEKQK